MWCSTHWAKVSVKLWNSFRVSRLQPSWFKLTHHQLTGCHQEHKFEHEVLTVCCTIKNQGFPHQAELNSDVMVCEGCIAAGSTLGHQHIALWWHCWCYPEARPLYLRVNVQYWSRVIRSLPSLLDGHWHWQQQYYSHCERITEGIADLVGLICVQSDEDSFAYSRQQNHSHIFQFQEDHLILALINIQKFWNYYGICSNIMW